MPTSAAEPESPALSPPDLSGEAYSVERVWNELQRWRRVSWRKGKSYVFPDQEGMARTLKVSLRTVRNAIHRLEELGLVRTVRSGRQNRYYFLDQGGVPTCTTPAKVADQTGKSCRSDRQKLPIRPAKVAGGFYRDLNSEKENTKDNSNSSANVAAAADLFAPLENQEAENALYALGLTRQLAAHYVARHGVEFARLVATHCAERFKRAAAGQGQPIKNPVGWIRHCFHCPAEHFEFVRGRWDFPARPAPSQPQAAVNWQARVAEQRRRLAALKEKR